MRSVLFRPWASIVFQVGVVTVAMLALMFFSWFGLVQTPVANAFFPRALAENAAGIEELVRALDQSGPADADGALILFEFPRRAAALSDQFNPGLRANPRLEAELLAAADGGASVLEGRDIRFERLNWSALRERLRAHDATDFNSSAAMQLAIRLEDGRILNVWTAPAASLQHAPAAALALGILLLLFLVALSGAVAAVLLHPIRRLEREAERVELGAMGTDVSEAGPVELRRISEAVNRMRKRLAGLVREREEMIAAIAHDIRTGLTRIRLRMDENGKVAAADIERDMSQIEALISDMVVYARAERPDTPRELIDIVAFAISVTDASPFAVGVAGDTDGEFSIIADPVALTRVLANLLENARRYGEGEIIVRFSRGEAGLDIDVEDNGPGIPDDQMERVFLPFFRGERSRNRATGGSGLGLGIARAITSAHGASLSLQNRAEGGLQARLHFPNALRL